MLACGLLALAFTFNTSANVQAATDVETVKDKKIDDIQTEDGLEVSSGNGTAILSLTRRPAARLMRSFSGTQFNDRSIDWSSFGFKRYTDSGENFDFRIWSPAEPARLVAPISGLYRLHINSGINIPSILEGQTFFLRAYINLPVEFGSTQTCTDIRIENGGLRIFPDGFTSTGNRFQIPSLRNITIDVDYTIPMNTGEFIVACLRWNGNNPVLSFSADHFIEFRYVGPLPENF